MVEKRIKKNQQITQALQPKAMHPLHQSKPLLHSIYSRRDFLKSSILSLSALGIGGLSSSCASLDQTLLDNRFSDGTVAIIGAGIGGLSLSYFLKSQKQPFVVFEASPRIGGRIYRTDQTEWGAYEFLQTDVGLKKLMQSMNLKSIDLDRETWTFENGSTEFLNSLKEKSVGLIEHRHLKLQHRLTRIRPLKDGFRLYFQTPNDEIDLDFSHVVLCLPGNQILNIEGLEEFSSKLTILPKLKSGQIVHAVRIVKPALFNSSNYQRGKGVLVTEFENDRLLRVRFNRNKTYLTIQSSQADPLREVNEIQKLIAKNVSSYFAKTDMTTLSESMMDWSTKENIDSGFFKIDYQSDLATSFFSGKSSLHLISDCLTSGEGRVENVIKLAQKTANLLNLYG